MKEQFIPYELALKLKELGFIGLDDFGQYIVDAEHKVGQYIHPSNKHLMSIGKNVILMAAPLWQQAFDWIMNKYHLFIFADHRINSIDFNKTYWYGIKKFKKVPFGSEVTVGIIDIGCHNSDLEAKEACLNRLIKLIENQNDNNE
jgi:hypothetical protein